ncbi:MAG: alpha/beta fold hydrolase [Myxococcota bacterium]
MDEQRQTLVRPVRRARHVSRAAPGGGEDLPIPARDGYPLAATRFGPAAPRAVVVVVPATGVPRGYYAPFAAHLARQGHGVVTFDYRGIGGSRPPRLRGFPARMADWGELDLTGVLDWIGDSSWDGAPVLVVAHSVGGQILPLADGLDRVRAAYMVGAQQGYWRHWDGAWRLALPLLWYGLIPLGVPLMGRLPAAVLGGGEDLPPGVGLDWARFCRHPDHILTHRPDTVERFAAVRFPIRMVTPTDDHFAPPRAVETLARYYRNAPVERRWVAPGEVGATRLGHFGFFRERFRDDLWPDAVAFLERHA